MSACGSARLSTWRPPTWWRPPARWAWRESWPSASRRLTCRAARTAGSRSSAPSARSSPSSATRRPRARAWGWVRCCWPSTRPAENCAMPARSAPDSTTRAWPTCKSAWRASRLTKDPWRVAARARMCIGWRPSCLPKSHLADGPALATSAIRYFGVCARTSRCERSPARRRSPSNRSKRNRIPRRPTRRRAHRALRRRRIRRPASSPIRIASSIPPRSSPSWTWRGITG
ncbi:hypothetical protein D3C85_1223190 [compost metagenome]